MATLLSLWVWEEPIQDQIHLENYLSWMFYDLNQWPLDETCWSFCWRSGLYLIKMNVLTGSKLRNAGKIHYLIASFRRVCFLWRHGLQLKNFRLVWQCHQLSLVSSSKYQVKHICLLMIKVIIRWNWGLCTIIISSEKFCQEFYGIMD